MNRFGERACKTLPNLRPLLIEPVLIAFIAPECLTRG